MRPEWLDVPVLVGSLPPCHRRRPKCTAACTRPVYFAKLRRSIGCRVTSMIEDGSSMVTCGRTAQCRGVEWADVVARLDGEGPSKLSNAAATGCACCRATPRIKPIEVGPTRTGPSRACSAFGDARLMGAVIAQLDTRFNGDRCGKPALRAAASGASHGVGGAGCVLPTGAGRRRP